MAKKARRVVKSKAKKFRSKGKGRSKMEVAGESHRHLLAYDQMLRDPCNANLVAPPYRGTDSGYLIRTTDNIAVTATGAGLTAGNVYASDFIFEYMPQLVSSGATNTAFAAGAQAPGGGTPVISYATTGTATGPITNFISGSGVVGRFRPAAACLKFIPSGPYTSRQGLIGLGYVQGFVAAPTTTMSIFQTLSQCQMIASNGSRSHEVRWLPTDADESWVVLGSSAGGAGCVYLVGKGVDSTATSATAAGINGYVEVTTIWEWQPALTNGINAAPRAPAPFTTQGVLSSIGDLGAYLFDGVRHEAGRTLYGLGKGAVKAATYTAQRLLTGGIGSVATRAGALPLMIAG